MIIQRSKLIKRDNKLYVDARSYEVQKCLKKREPLIIEIGSERMVIPPEALKSYKEFEKQRIQSQFGGSYKLYSYEWSPESREEELKRYLL